MNLITSHVVIPCMVAQIVVLRTAEETNQIGEKSQNILIFQGEKHGNNERFARVWRTLRASNKKMESKNEKIHIW